MSQSTRLSVKEPAHKRTSSKVVFLFLLTFSILSNLCVYSFLSLLKPKILVLDQLNSPNLNKGEF